MGTVDLNSDPRTAGHRSSAGPGVSQSSPSSALSMVRMAAGSSDLSLSPLAQPAVRTASPLASQSVSLSAGTVIETRPTAGVGF